MIERNLKTMNFLKKIPIRYTGELHDIVLINFSVDMSEIERYIPVPLRPLNFDGRALISMVNVRLKHMRPSVAPPFLDFAYQHIGFRVLLEDAMYNEDRQNKGIYFLRSFTNRSAIAWAGGLLTDYRLEKAELWNYKRNLDLRCGDEILSYEIDEVRPPASRNESLLATVGAIDRAYSILGREVRLTRIVREKWPLQEMRCTHFATSFFRTARLEGAFFVSAVIPYTWLPPRAVLPLPERKKEAPVFALYA